MDHLPLPRHPTTSPPRVRYLGPTEDEVSDPYDGGDFATYPLRSGWQNAQEGNFAQFFMLRARTQRDIQASEEDLELESFLQTWLFFGFLYLLLSPVGLYDSHDFIGEDVRGKYVHTRHLIGKLKLWEENMSLCQYATKQRMKREIEVSFNVARDVVGIASRTATCNLDRASLQSLAALYETVAIIFNAVFEEPNTKSLLWSSIAQRTFSRDEKQEMVQQGWCHYDIELAAHDFMSASGQHYVQRLKKGDYGLHDNCDRYSCRLTQIDLNTYEPRHVEGCHSCKLVGGNPQQMRYCLQTGTFPLFRVVSSTNGTSIEFRPYEDGVAFVALSHVWADGLGNPLAASLPECQLLRLQRFVDGIVGQTYVWREGRGERMRWIARVERKELFIWCDTICCPPAPPGCSDQDRSDKNSAIGKIMDVYRKAEYVAVLESSLETLSIEEIGSIEAATRIFTSAWIRRLWTFQEAALAHKLLVKFQEQRLVDFAELWKDSQEMGRQGSLQMRVLAISVTSHFGRLRNYFDLAEDPDPDLRMVVRAIACRKVTVSSDEPICLGAVFGLDNKKLAETAPALRMAEMWRLMGQKQSGVPGTVIFTSLPRLDQPGFRWAPATVLLDIGNIEIAGIDLLASEDVSPSGQLTPHGLRVHRPGWRIRHGYPPLGLPSSFFPATMSPQPIFFLRDCDGRWLSVRASEVTGTSNSNAVSPGQLISDSQQEWYLIREDIGPVPEIGHQRGGTRGLIGYFTTQTNNTEVFHTALTVWVCRLPPSSEILFQASYKAAGAVLRGWNIFWLRIVSRGLVLALRLVSWLPSAPQRLMQRIVVRLCDILTSKLTIRLLRHIKAAGVEFF